MPFKKNNKINVKHGLARHPIYYIWKGIRQRCHNKNNPHYPKYGGRGISVCEEWRNDFMSFYEWVVSNGWRSDLQIDRIDNDGDYHPLNCRITTRVINVRNRRTTLKYEYNGVVKTLYEWAQDFNINYKCLHNRVRYLNIDFETAVTMKRYSHV